MDESRDAFLMGHGYKVRRFKTREIRETTSDVLYDIAKILKLDYAPELQ